MVKLFILAITMCSLGNAWAGPSDPIISMAWMGETIPGQTSSTLQLNITTVKAVKLVSASSPVAGSIEIQRVMKQKGKMQANTVDDINLPAHNTIAFGSHGLFLMMTGIKQPLKAGDRVPLSFVFAVSGNQRKSISAEAEVRQMELSYKHYGPKEVYDHR